MNLATYYYVVVPGNQYGLGDPSDILIVRVENLLPSPVLTLVEKVQKDDIRVFWDPVPNTVNYIVYMSLVPINGTTIFGELFSSPLLDANVHNYTFIETGFGDHYFVVVAVNGTGYSEPSNVLYFDNSLRAGPDYLPYYIAGGAGAFILITIPLVMKYYKDRKMSDPNELLKKYT